MSSRPRRISDLVLHGRIALALSVAGALILAVVGASGVLLAYTITTQDRVVGSFYNSLRISQTYYIQMLDAETSVRGYALSGGNESVLVPFTTSEQPWEHPISGAVLTALPGQQQAIASLRSAEQAAIRWHDDWALPTIARTRLGQDTSAAEVQRGKDLFDRFRAGYNTYIDELRQDRDVEARRLVVLTNLLFVTGLAVSLIAVGAGFMLWWLLRRWVSRPVTRLAHEVRVVSGEDLDHEVEVAGPREFVQLGDDIEMMRKRLVNQIAEVESARLEVADARGRLERQAEELQRSNRELEQFAYVASHDLQEPLRKVASFCQLLERRYNGKLDARADQYIHFAVDGARRMQQLINDLLDFSRVGRLSSPATQVDTARCLRMAMANVETALAETGARIEAEGLPVVTGEAPLLTQLFQNLISNAIKFRSQDDPVIRIGARRVGGDWEFWCSDNGIGIPAEYADRVFLIFQRLHAKEVYEGTGIGLAMCRKIVEYHGGTIWVDGEAGHVPGHVPGDVPRRVPGEPARPGTTIRWTLPAGHAPSISPPSRVGAASS
jgi:signal transduction histidine kinase